MSKEDELLKNKICNNCNKKSNTVKTRPARVGTVNYCEKCYEIQILMS